MTTPKILTVFGTRPEATKPYAAMARAHNPFGDGRAVERIVELLAV